METYDSYNIEIPNGKTTGEITTICPQCSHTRKKSKLKCLGVNLDLKIWKCNHCGWVGRLKEEKAEKKQYAKPVLSEANLSEKIINYFKGRGISIDTLNHFKITESDEYMPQNGTVMRTINFNYFRDGELVNIKYRTGNKLFKLYKDAELIFYNLDSIKDSEECWIVEGEIGALTLHEAGLTNVVSVPNGANLNSNNLQYLDNCIDYFLNKKRIHLACDNDTAGRKLRDDLAIRFGKHKCDYVDYGDCKDENEVLVKHGKGALIDRLADLKLFPIEGVFTIRDIGNEIDDLYDNGLDKGIDLGIDGFKLNIVKGYVTTITGIPSHGKALSIDTDILTIDGYKKMKDIQIGDVVFDENGEPCNVTNMTEIMYNRPCYKMIFSDSSEVICDREHLWVTETFGKQSIKLTQEIYSTIKDNHVINFKKQFNIIECIKIDSVPVKCIEVDSKSHLYLCSKSNIPTHNSDFVDYMCVKSRILHDWNGAFYSPENRPTELHFAKIARKIIGKPWDGINRMTKKEVEAVKEYLDKKMFFIKPEKDFTLDSILNTVRDLQQRYSMDYFVIDAWNKLEHKENDTHAVGVAYDKITNFCEVNNIHAFIVAHPTKIQKDKNTGMYEIPTLYSISGSSNFYNKTDNGLTVYRNFETGVSSIYRQKIKFDHWGEEGYSEYMYDTQSKRYYALGQALDKNNWIEKVPQLMEVQREIFDWNKIHENSNDEIF